MTPFKSPRERDVPQVFGPAAGAACTAGRCILPFAFPLAWDEAQKVQSFACHTLVASHLTSIFAQAATQYGEADFRRLRLDRFGGCFNHRAKRGGASLSMHSWGIAVDLDPLRNQLRWTHDRASFAGPDYLAFWKIVEAHGAISLGRVRDFDWMHFQFAAL